MTRLILSISLVISAAAMAQTPMIAAPERRIYVTSTGDVLEWQPGLGIVVLSGKTTHVTQRRALVSDGKAIIQTERSIRVQNPSAIKRPIDLRKAPVNEPLRDEGESLMEEIEP